MLYMRRVLKGDGDEPSKRGCWAGKRLRARFPAFWYSWCVSGRALSLPHDKNCCKLLMLYLTEIGMARKGVLDAGYW